MLPPDFISLEAYIISSFNTSPSGKPPSLSKHFLSKAAHTFEAKYSFIPYFSTSDADFIYEFSG